MILVWRQGREPVASVGAGRRPLVDVTPALEITTVTPGIAAAV